MQTVLKVENINKSYGENKVLKDLSFVVKRGEIYALLGPNGAGKTTTLEIIEGLREADSGSISILGSNDKTLKKIIMEEVGIQLQNSGLPESMTVKEAINLFSSIRGLCKNNDLIKNFDLEDLMNKKYQELSTGQKRRLNIYLATAHNPKIVFFDEPTAGLDVESRKKLHTYIKHLKEQGVSIVLSSHDMAEVEVLADKVGIILNGEISLEGSPKELTSSGENLTKVSFKLDKGRTFNYQSSMVTRSLREADYVVYFTKKPIELVLDIMSIIKMSKLELIDFRVEKPSLEEMFIEIINKNMEVE